MEAGNFVRYHDIPKTNAELEYADLITLDLEDFDRSGGKHRLANQLKDAIHRIGFFYLINFGLSEQEVDRQFDLAARTFALPESTKAKYKVNPMLPGGALGFKLKDLDTTEQVGGNIELYDDPKYNAVFADRPRPPTIQEMKTENERFCRHLHFHVLRRLFILSAIILELQDEETLWKMHDYESLSNCHMRYMLCHPRTSLQMAELEARGLGDFVKGHTDFGSFTLLFRQPIVALQVRTEDSDRWKWVKPVRNSITVNVADTLSFLTGGHLKSSIHRVVLPPEEQRHVPRLGVIYFSRPDDDVKLMPVKSPLIEPSSEVNHGLTAGEWMLARHKGLDFSAKPGKKLLVKGIEVDGWA